VLLYMREHADRSVTPQELANRLALTVELSSAILADLTKRGLVTKLEAAYRYQAASGEIDQLVAVLAEAYRSRRLAVTNEIYSKPLQKVKTFAEAFRLRREE
jgi:hypothetical protein